MPLSINEVLEKIKNRNTEILRKEKDVYYSVSLHTKGARPKFQDPKSENGAWITPPFYFGEEYQHLFETYLLSKHPREPKITRNWRFSQYRPLTKRPFLQLIEIITGAIFQDSQYTISLPNKDDQDYIFGNNFLNGFNIIQLFQNVLIQGMIEDPNGYIVRIPKRPSYETLKSVEVDILHVRTIDVLHQPDGEDFIFKSQDGKYIYWINKVAIIRFVEQTNKEYNLEDARGYYAHLFGYLPVSQMGGIWNTEGFYNSYFDKAIPIADEFISNYSAEQLIDKEVSHPFIQQAALDCPSCFGEGKVQRKCAKTTENPAGLELVICGRCKGTKQISFNPADRLEVPKEEMDKDLIKIINPDVNINKYHREKNDALMQGILDALNLVLIQQAQSGNAKAIDQEKLYQFISNVSNHVFETLIFPSIKDVIGYRNVKSANGILLPNFYEFILIKPSQFNIKTANELLTEITGLNTAQAPPFIRKKLVAEYVDKRFSGDNIFVKKSQVIEALDKCFIYTPVEKQTLVAIGEITKEDLRLSSNIGNILDKLEREKGQDYILKTSIEEIEKIIMVEVAKIPLPQIDQQQQNNQSQGATSSQPK